MRTVSQLPSQRVPSAVDQAFERGYVFGRDGVIRAVEQALAEGADIQQLLGELRNVEFRL